MSTRTDIIQYQKEVIFVWNIQISMKIQKYKRSEFCTIVLIVKGCPKDRGIVNTITMGK